MRGDIKSNALPLIAFVIVSLTVVGYFTGLQSPMKAPQSPPPLLVEEGEAEQISPTASGVIPATHYTNMAEATRTLRRQPRLSSLKSTIEPLAEIKIEPEDKLIALRKREQNRAFNGAPPTIPHPIDQRSEASCIACHGDGVKTKSLRISRMSHGLLTNCTQCHVESNSHYLAAIVFRENQFQGLEAPTEGPRAFPGAPPQIPHSTWMRSDCMSCHGYVGLQGIRTTHPWRHNCQQCHAPSAAMDQTFLVEEPQFLPGPNMKE